MDDQNKKHQNEPENKKLKPSADFTDTLKHVGIKPNMEFEEALTKVEQRERLPLIDTDFDEDFDEEALRMFDKYELNKKFVDLLAKEPLVGKVTKIAVGRNMEDIILRTQILSWTKDIKPKNPADKEYLAFKGTRFSCIGQFGALISNKSKKPYWGIRFDLGNSDYMNYAISLSDMRILIDLKIFRLKASV